MKAVDKIQIAKEFEILIQDRDVMFCHDRADGYFIKVSDQGGEPRHYDVADCDVSAQHKDIFLAMKAAVKWMRKGDEKFRARFFR